MKPLKSLIISVGYELIIELISLLQLLLLLLLLNHLLEESSAMSSSVVAGGCERHPR